MPETDFDIDPLAAFTDVPSRKLPILDRSTLEGYETCPFAARARADGLALAVGMAAISGEEVHKAIAAAIEEYVGSCGVASRADLVKTMEAGLRHCRPDVQPDVLQSSRSVWQVADLLLSLHPDNLLRWDGGEEERSGQLAWDISSVRLTSELDLLHADKTSPEVLNEVDWKSGWKFWAAEQINDSFQFQTHAFLVFHNYPSCAALKVRVLNTRSGAWTYNCLFDRRRDLENITARIQRTISIYRDCKQAEPPTWPALEKCRICDCKAVCPERSKADWIATTDELLRSLVVAESYVDQLKERAKELCDMEGKDLVSDDGKLRFGRNSPQKRKRDAVLYEGE